MSPDISNEPKPESEHDDSQKLPKKNPSVFGVEGSRFRLYDDETIENAPNTPDLIEGFLPAASLAVVFGEPKVGKSFFLVDISFSVSCGLVWNGRQVLQGPVVYIAAEGRRGYAKRIRAWKAAHGLSGALGVHFLPEAVHLIEAGQTSELLSLIRALPVPPVLVIVDTLARTMVGGDENSSKDMGTVVAAAEQIKSEIGAAVMFAHHPAKGNKGEPRGSSALPGAAEMMVELTRSGDIVTATCRKLKDAEEFERMMFSLEPAADSLVLFPLVALEAVDARGKSLPKQEREALVVLASSEQGQLRHNEWRSASAKAGIPASTFGNVLKKLVLRDLVRKAHEGHAAPYAVTEAGFAILSVNIGGSNGPDM